MMVLYKDISDSKDVCSFDIECQYRKISASLFLGFYFSFQV